MSVVRKYLESKYSRTADVVSEMGDSSELSFCEVGSAENDGQLGSPKFIAAESIILEDICVDIVSTAKINEVKPPNDSDKDMSGSSMSVTQACIGAEPNVPYREKTSLNKPVARAKVPFEKGYSQMDWLKLTRTHPDLSGVDMLMKAAGKDCTALFNQYHAWVNPEFLLEKCYIGSLDRNDYEYVCKIQDAMASGRLCFLSPNGYAQSLMNWRMSIASLWDYDY